jgi:sodium-dependent dicarboxylate transporter 2/3/5
MNTTHKPQRNLTLLIIGVLLSVCTFFVLYKLPIPQRLMAAIFVMTVFYWILEPIPMYATALLAAFLCALWLGPAAALFGHKPVAYDIFFAPFSSPVVVLMFGGFVMADVFTKNNLDLEFCRLSIMRMGNRPRRLLFGIMLLTAMMSMWMSNTATTAIMLATILPIVRMLPRDASATRALILGIPFAANIGGIATPIGTPPNAIAIGMLADRGINISFLSWMIAALPLMIAILIITYLLLIVFFRMDDQPLDLKLPKETTAANRNLVYTVFFITVLLWMTDFLHRIPPALVALLPVVIFAIIGLFRKEHLREISWDILFLISGGLVLSVGIKHTGLGITVVNALALDGLSPFFALLILCSIIAILSNVLSHTAASNIILPLALTIGSISPSLMGISIAICASYGMSLPLSTPPNAIAYGSQMVSIKDMAKIGIFITLIGIILTVLYEYALFGLFPSLFKV